MRLLTARRDRLRELGVAEERIYLDHGLTGTNRKRPGLDQALAAVRGGDTLTVPKLDRLTRSVPDARAIGDGLGAHGSSSPTTAAWIGTGTARSTSYKCLTCTGTTSIRLCSASMYPARQPCCSPISRWIDLCDELERLGFTRFIVMPSGEVVQRGGL